MAAADTDPEVDIGVACIGQTIIGIDSQPDLGKALGKGGDAMHQPAGGEDRGDRDGQHAVIAAFRQIHGAGQVTKALR